MTTIQLVTLITAIAGAVCGVIGAVLGVMNTWNRMSQDRVRLKITPKNAKPNKVGCLHEWTVSVDVINLSAFPVTIEEVGFELETKEHMIQQPMESLNRGLLPIRLDSREALMILYPAKFLDDPRFAEVRTAYARCQCGTTRHGSSKALKQLVENAREKRQSE